MKVIVIGAGLIGIQTAYFLNKSGHNVILIEKEKNLASQTSFANGGRLTPSHSAPWNYPGIFAQFLKSIFKKDSSILFNLSSFPKYFLWILEFIKKSSKSSFQKAIIYNSYLANYSLELLRDLRKKLNISYDNVNLGSLIVYRKDFLLKKGVQIARSMSSCGINYNICNPEDLCNYEPALSDSKELFSGGVFYPDDEQGDAHQFILKLADYLKKDGVIIKTNEFVNSFLIEKNAVVGVQTNKNIYLADSIVIAAAVWSRELLKELNLNLPIQAVKGYTLTIDTSLWDERPKISVLDDESKIFVTPLGNRIRAGGLADFTDFNYVISKKRINKIKNIMLRLYPKLYDYNNIIEWAAFRPVISDSVPVISETDIDNIFINTGHGHLGWTTACASGKIIADLISGKSSAININPYSYHRFKHRTKILS